MAEALSGVNCIVGSILQRIILRSFAVYGPAMCDESATMDGLLC
jgi:hypothetical protein